MRSFRWKPVARSTSPTVLQHLTAVLSGNLVSRYHGVPTQTTCDFKHKVAAPRCQSSDGTERLSFPRNSPFGVVLSADPSSSDCLKIALCVADVDLTFWRAKLLMSGWRATTGGTRFGRVRDTRPVPGSVRQMTSLAETNPR